jgi:hypothetical protein
LSGVTPDDETAEVFQAKALVATAGISAGRRR